MFFNRLLALLKECIERNLISSLLKNPQAAADRG